jgi:PII-like signaling protein
MPEAQSVAVVRIYLTEADHGAHKALRQEILTILHEQHRVRGVTVFRGIAGFGDSGEVHASDILRLKVDLPIVIEFFDRPAIVDEAIKLITKMVPEGRILRWSASCL